MIKKVKGISNPADMMTKSVNKEKLDKYMDMTKQKVVEGRAKEALHVKKDKELERCRAKDNQEKRQRNYIDFGASQQLRSSSKEE